MRPELDSRERRPLAPTQTCRAVGSARRPWMADSRYLSPRGQALGDGAEGAVRAQGPRELRERPGLPRQRLRRGVPQRPQKSSLRLRGWEEVSGSEGEDLWGLWTEH